MSTTTLETQQTLGTPAPLPYTPARTATLVLMAFAAVYVVWGSTYLAIRVGIESFPPLVLAGAPLNHRNSVVRGLALENGRSPDGGALAHRRDHGFPAAFYWKWRRVRGGEDGSVRGGRPFGCDRLLVDGFG